MGIREPYSEAVARAACERSEQERETLLSTATRPHLPRCPQLHANR